ncbi:MAG TPA: aminotransferase class I/II-fold pyridoxal phosphate-dependent enzyme [Spirochaetota bacterium]|nr:aminotransferase class I/II-fold pyridoxal phosphate-dependent enzyme [Spirochaetota bacterium]
MIADRMKQIDASGIRRVFDLAGGMQDPVNLSIGQPDFPVPDKLKQAARQAINSDCNSYTPTQGTAPLLALISAQIEKEYRREAEGLMITSGVSGGILLVFNVLLNPGDEIIIPDPYFVMYKHIARLLGAVPVYLDTYPDFSIDPGRLEKLITPRTKAIIINSPANPTGKIYTQTEINHITELARKQGLFIISDEIYQYFNYTSVKELPSPFCKYEKTVLLNGFSKSHSLTGWRLGYAAGPAPVINEMKKLQQYTFVCAPAPFQQAALHLYDKEIMDYIREQLENYKQKNDIIYNGLKDKFDITPSDGAFYSFVRVPGTDADTFVKKAIANNLLIIPGNVFSEKNTHFRISFAVSDDTLRQGVKILNALV